jgi:pyrroloquinoline quinone (PQQ) biosynthesis protein C
VREPIEDGVGIDRSVLEAVASRLTEIFSPQTVVERVDDTLPNYDFATGDTLAYLPLA